MYIITIYFAVARLLQSSEKINNSIRNSYEVSLDMQSLL
jgi:hypothetical protein